MALVVAIMLWTTLHFEYVQNAEILEEPTTQYVLIESNATFTCKTTGTEAYWILNDIPMTVSYPSEMQAYQEYGVVFMENISRHHYNLTMNIPATVVLNNTVIFCSAIGRDYTIRMSQEVHLIVFNTLRPYQPSFVSANIRYSLENPPMVIAIITPVPRWPGYEESNIWMNITDISDDTLLSQTSFSSSAPGNNTVNVSLPDAVINQCTLLRVTVTAVSNLYGEGEATSIYTELLKRPGEFKPDGLNLTVFQLSTDTRPVLDIQVQLPDVCQNQSINYTFIIGRDLIEGPFFHKGPGLVTHCIEGLENNQSYFIQVQVSSVSGRSQSPRHYFDTYFRTVMPPQSERSVCMDNAAKQTTFGTLRNSDDEQNETVIALGTVLALVTLMLASMSIILVLFCVYHHRGFGERCHHSISAKKDDLEDGFIMMPSPEPAIDDLRIDEQLS